MSLSTAGTWVPTPQLIADANVTALARHAGVDGFDALERFALADPSAYWRTVNEFCRIAWSKPYDRFCDLTRGREFPQWFVGGELNWIDSVFAWGDRGGADRMAVVAESEDGTLSRITYAELRQRVMCFAAGLQDLGLRRGDRIGLLMESGVEAVVSLLAISAIGAIVVPLFSGFGADAIVARLGSCSARAIVATTGFRRRGRLIDVTIPLQEARRNLPATEMLILKPAPGHAPAIAGALDWNQVLSRSPALAAPERMSANDPFMVIYTSGTTGKPKGAVHTHGGFPLKIAHDAAVHFDVKPGDVFCWPADMGWIAGALVISSALLRGATLVCYDGAPDFPDWSRMSGLIARHQITHYGSAPTLIRGLAAHETQALAGEVASVRLLITAGEAIDPEHFLWFQRNFGRGVAPLINYTGGTEVSGALLASVVVKPIRPAAFNSASPGVAVDVVDSEGGPLTEAVGELAVREPFVGMTQSFWQDDSRYLDTYWQAIPGLWLHGDLAIRLGADGFMLRGRSDDTIKLAGKRLGPAEVEELLLELPDINEAAAIGVDDPVKGQKLIVFLVAAPDAATEGLSERAGAQVEQRLGKPFRPASVHLVAQLPKTKSSKVMRRVIRSLYCGLPLGDLSSVENMDALQEISRVSPPSVIGRRA